MSCCSESGLLPVPEAIQRLTGSVDATQQLTCDTISIDSACGRVLAEPVFSRVNVPPLDNSAMDGYALCFEDWYPGITLPISQRIPAGVAPESLSPGSVARLFTGAPVPEGADTVVMQEDCTCVGEDRVVLPEALSRHSHIRAKGEDIRAGQELFPAGHRLRGEDIGLIASVGIADVSVFQTLRVAVLVSGDELLEPGQPPESGKIYNANGYLLKPLLEKLDLDIVLQAQVADTLEATIDALKHAADVADVIITTGGVSVGEEDHIKPAVERLGRLDLWKINIKPGKPFGFGAIRQSGRNVPFIGLPGNPVSVFSTLLVLGVPYLRVLQGQAYRPPVAIPVCAGFAVAKAGKRDEYLRVRLSEKHGSVVLEKYPNQGSGVLSSVCRADGFALIRAGERYAEGDRIPYYAFAQLLG